MRTKPTRPVPVPNPLTEGFWAAAKQGRLAIQRCRDCGRRYHPPSAVCNRCYSTNLGFDPVSGRGTILSRTIMHDPRIRGFGESVPFAVIVVELAEQKDLLVVANLLGAAPEAAVIGRHVVVDFEEMEGGFVLPQFRLAEGDGR